MSREPKANAVPNADGTYNIQVKAANGEILFNDREARPRENLRRDWGRIQRAVARAKLKILSPDENVYPD